MSPLSSLAFHGGPGFAIDSDMETTLKVACETEGIGELIRRHESRGHLVILRGRMSRDRSQFELAIRNSRISAILEELSRLGACVEVS